MGRDRFRRAAGCLRVVKIAKKRRRRNPAAPFTTSTLQQEAARRLGFTAQRTLRTAQQLYEGVDTGSGLGGFITYMRTDSVTLAGDALQRFLVEQIALYELLSHRLRTLQPDDASSIERMQDELALRRDRAVHILDQMLLVESGIVELWSVRIRHLLSILEEQGFGGDA